MAYCATSDITAYGNFPSTTISSDIVVIGSLITRAEAIIDQYTGRTFECTSAETSTHYFDIYDVLDDGVTLFFEDDFMGVSTDASAITAGTDAITSTAFTYLPHNGTPYFGIRLKDNSASTWDDETSDGDWENAIQIKGYWCYSKTAPADIQHACIRLVYYLYKQRETNADLDRPLLTGDGVTIMPTKLPADVTSILNRYKRVRTYG